ncbi:hypothetical protein [Plebeiibacterium marinum]|uniref:BioF2-like acetyltransferase domain-containing protein n=1 Tax=Plebeiibacterium marinum TaxID=2992111 RepID=A0AAE3MA84_9BACT|nr:hypothetical protein [Plebeiobacterium marinum]MCW3804156.1 hypothetical protein [Plebeiobacterium marinum]
MIIEIDERKFQNIFGIDPHPFISNKFLSLNRNKVEKIVWLVENIGKPEIGLVAGIKDDKLLSPFSAPFGGFHFKKENIYSTTVDHFILLLQEYVMSVGYKEFRVTLPPNIYHQTFNAKCTSSLLRANFQSLIPEITSWVDLQQFKGVYGQKNSREYYRQALRNELVFEYTETEDDKLEGYNLIKDNRAKFGRPIYMSLDDINQTSNLWPVDFFKVSTKEGNIVSFAILYRLNPQIVYAVFWGDNELGRSQRAMDFLLLNLWSHYHKLGYKYVDLGISTEDSIPNSGLLRFKETHEAVSSLRYKFNLIN